jgi:phenylalanyl-tRNA synthetase beta chain
MLFSYNWLRQLVPGLDMDPHALAQRITLKTAESEGVEAWGTHLDEVCAAKVTAVEPIAGSHNVKATVDTGRYGKKIVVCGAPNCRVNLVTAYVPVGVTLPEKKIESATISGVLSEGMLASGAELGLNRQTEGVIELSGLKPGDPLASPDFLIEIDNKSLTHRPDLWGHHGMAREVAAISELLLKDPVDLDLIPEPGSGGFPIEIEDFSACSDFVGMLVDNVTVTDSPLWLQAKLQSLGMNPISNLVDITNLVTAELPKPMHVYDRDKLVGGKLSVRWAKAGESLLALNGETYDLDPSILVIADEKGPVGIAGIIGGMETGVTASTKNVLFESANFHAGLIRKTSTKLRLRTDASMRFEKSLDPKSDLRSMGRAVELMRELSPDAVVGKTTVAGVAAKVIPAIELPLEWLNRKLGQVIAKAEVVKILASLEFQVVDQGNELSVTPPSWRATKDVSLKEDLLEEVGRMIGYINIAPQAPLTPSVVPQSNASRIFFNQVRQLAADFGYTESYNYSFVSDELATRYGFAPESHLRLENPLASDLNLMRLSLVPRIGENVNENRKHFDEFRLFEIGREIHPTVAGQLPDEKNFLVATSYRKADKTAECLNDVKLLAQALIPGFSVQPRESRIFEHPFRSADLIWQNEKVGRLFEFHPKFVEVGRAAVVEIDLERLMQMAPSAAKYRAIRKVPASSFDLSLTIKPRDLISDLRETLRGAAGEALEQIEFLADFVLPDGNRSVSHRFVVAASDRTLSNEEVSAIRARMIDAAKTVGYGFKD